MVGSMALVGALVLENSTEFCAENLRPRAACGTETHGSRNSETHGSGYGDSELPGAVCLLRWVRFIWLGGSCCGGIGECRSLAALCRKSAVFERRSFWGAGQFALPSLITSEAIPGNNHIQSMVECRPEIPSRTGRECTRPRTRV